MNRKSVFAWLAMVYSFQATAADLTNFPPTQIASGAWGSISSPTLSQVNVSDGSGKLYRGWFDNAANGGDLLAHSISSTGTVTSAAAWSAKALIGAYNTRELVLGSAGSATDYGCSSTSDPLKRYVCGDTFNEGSTYRGRSSKLGAMIHSNPVYVGAPKFSYNFNNYLTFRNTNQSRAARIYAAANDGILHSFDTNGNEIFGFIPGLISSSLSSWAANDSNNQYLLDGPLTGGDVYANFGGGASWKTLLVGGLGAGGKGYYLLDVTTPAAISDTIATLAGMKQWQFNPTGMGYSFGKPLLARTNDAGKWALIAPNGYAASGKPILYIREIQSLTTVIKDLQDGTDATNNGLSSVSAIDINNDSKIDYIYAGDLNGNLYRFNVSSSTPNDATYGWTRTKIFTATDGTNPQPILAAPELSLTNSGQVMIYFGTGDPWGVSSAAKHSLYALKDDLTSATAYTRANLTARKLAAISGQTDFKTLDSTGSYADPIDWTAAKGWYMDLQTNESLLQQPLLHDSRIQWMAHNLDSGDNWLSQLSYKEGLLPNEIIFDADDDGDLDANDNLSSSKVVSIKKASDLISMPTVATLGNGKALSYFNQWDEGTAGSSGTTSYEYDVAKCSTIIFNRIRMTSDRGTIKFTPTGGPAGVNIHASIKVTVVGSEVPLVTDYTSSDAINAGAGSGVIRGTAGTVQNWFGLQFRDIDDESGHSNNTRNEITYHGPYKFTGFTLTTNDSSIDEIDNQDGLSIKSCAYPSVDYATKSCAGTPSCSQINQKWDSLAATSWGKSGFTWSTLNASGSVTEKHAVTIPGVAGASSTGTPDEQLQSGNENTTGRLRWRELLF